MIDLFKFCMADMRLLKFSLDSNYKWLLILLSQNCDHLGF